MPKKRGIRYEQQRLEALGIIERQAKRLASSYVKNAKASVQPPRLWTIKCNKVEGLTESEQEVFDRMLTARAIELVERAGFCPFVIVEN